MSDPKKHHFSPVFYLKGWCNADSKLAEYYRPHKKVVSRLVHPEATGFQMFLYTLDGESDEKKQTIEKDYMSPIVDNRAAIALKMLIAQQEIDSEEIRSHWTRFLMASLVRQPQAIKQTLSDFTETLRKNLADATEEYQAWKTDADPATPFEWLEVNKKHVVKDTPKRVMVASIEHECIGNIIINMKWATLDLSASDHELLTSDAPNIRFCGLKDRRCLIAFPLSPRFLFVATHDGRAESFLRAQGESKIANWMNDKIVRMAERYVYGRTESHLRFVENRLRPAGA
jgi:hypothetical protein